MLRLHNPIYTAFLLVTVLLPLVSQPAAAQQELVSLRDTGLVYVLSESGGDIRLTITPEGGVTSLKHDLTANVFAIENPTRLVIDVPQHRSKSPYSVPLNHPVVSGLRLGVHPDKTRLVVDIKDSRQPDYSVRSDQELGALVIDVRFSGPPPEIPPPLTQPETPPGPVFEPPTADVAPPATDVAPPAMPNVIDQAKTVEEPAQAKQDIFASADAKKDVAPPAMKPLEPPTGETSEAYVVRDNTVIKAPTEKKEALGTHMNVGTVQPTTPPQGDQAVSTSAAKVKGIFYQTTKKSKMSSIVVDVDGLNTYSLSQRDKNKYELVLENARLVGEHLTLPQFPPDTFTGFEVVVARPMGDGNVAINVYVEENVKLFPYIARGRLWLKASTPIAE